MNPVPGNDPQGPLKMNRITAHPQKSLPEADLFCIVHFRFQVLFQSSFRSGNWPPSAGVELVPVVPRANEPVHRVSHAHDEAGIGSGLGNSAECVLGGEVIRRSVEPISFGASGIERLHEFNTSMIMLIEKMGFLRVGAAVEVMPVGGFGNFRMKDEAFE